MNKWKKIIIMMAVATAVTTVVPAGGYKAGVSLAEETKSEKKEEKTEEKVTKGMFAWQLVSEDAVLSDAKWTVQEWDKEKKAYSDMPTQPTITFHADKNSKWGLEKGGYYVTDLLTITEKNEGWFKIVEKEAPSGYINSGAAYEGCLARPSGTNTIFTTDEKQAVAISKKSLSNDKQKPAEETNVSVPQTDLANEKQEKENATSLQLFGNTVIEDVTQQENNTEKAAGGSEAEVTSRQFIKFATTDGNIYYIVINHTNQGDRVLMLREVSTADLAAIAKSGNQAIDPLIAQAFSNKQGAAASADNAPPTAAQNANQANQDSGQKKPNYPLLIGSGIFVVGGLIYIFVIKRKKPKQDEEPEYHYEAFESDMDDE